MSRRERERERKQVSGGRLVGFESSTRQNVTMQRGAAEGTARMIEASDERGGQRDKEAVGEADGSRDLRKRPWSKCGRQ